MVIHLCVHLSLQYLCVTQQTKVLYIYLTCHLNYTRDTLNRSEINRHPLAQRERLDWDRYLSGANRYKGS